MKSYYIITCPWKYLLIWGILLRSVYLSCPYVMSVCQSICLSANFKLACNIWSTLDTQLLLVLGIPWVMHLQFYHYCPHCHLDLEHQVTLPSHHQGSAWCFINTSYLTLKSGLFICIEIVVIHASVFQAC